MLAGLFVTNLDFFIARVAAFNAYGLALGAAAVFGQLIGGLLIKADLFGWDWRTICLINVPIGALVLLVTPKAVPESKAGDGRTGLDHQGTARGTAHGSFPPLPAARRLRRAAPGTARDGAHPHGRGMARHPLRGPAPGADGRALQLGTTPCPASPSASSSRPPRA
ncbi:hypothetical protein ACFY8K_25645 [Streptomyces misionensis]|uniref:hypothetical protein n=1 Tax=Streptomyces misionensis TaxID=67331 RepID=UPI00368D31BD